MCVLNCINCILQQCKNVCPICICKCIGLIRAVVRKSDMYDEKGATHYVCMFTNFFCTLIVLFLKKYVLTRFPTQINRIKSQKLIVPLNLNPQKNVLNHIFEKKL